MATISMASGVVENVTIEWPEKYWHMKPCVLELQWDIASRKLQARGYLYEGMYVIQVLVRVGRSGEAYLWN